MKTEEFLIKFKQIKNEVKNDPTKLEILSREKQSIQDLCYDIDLIGSETL